MLTHFLKIQHFLLKLFSQKSRLIVTFWLPQTLLCQNSALAGVGKNRDAELE